MKHSSSDVKTFQQKPLWSRSHGWQIVQEPWSWGNSHTVIPTRNQFLINFCRLMQTEIYLTVHDLCLASRQDKYLGLSEWICIKWSLINQTSWGTSIPINSGYCIKLIHFNIILKVETTSKQWVDKLETAQCTADKQRKS